MRVLQTYVDERNRVGKHDVLSHQTGWISFADELTKNSSYRNLKTFCL